ncbi:RmlC-like cupin domain-containing protein [Leptodontidium sp. MPI-SDFR-AT-0119]|nr:RmlC-like cupin domain-containing protein [Leptodontidium sp. MPI-SDFR-AT-0119]
MSPLLKAIVIAFAAGTIALPTSGPSPSSSSVAPAPPAATPDRKALYQDLFTSPSATERFQRLLVDPATGNLLSGDALRSRIVFDYNIGPTDQAGKITAAVAASFPILVDQDISTVTAFLNPCSLLIPHTHPQIESLVVTQGNLTTGTLIPGLVGPGGGTGEIVQDLSQYQGTVFPAGAIHYQLNPSCKPSIFVSSLSSSDPGTTLESTFFSLNGEVVAAALGFPDAAINGKDINSIRNKIPQGVIIAVEKCMKKCNLPIS